MREHNVDNTAVVMSRWYNHVHIGPTRHRLMAECITECLRNLNENKEQETTERKFRKITDWTVVERKTRNPGKHLLLLTSSIGKDLQIGRLTKVDQQKCTNGRSLKIKDALHALDSYKGTKYDNVVIITGSNDLAEVKKIPGI